LGSTDQSPYAMAQLYQFLASGGEIQPLHAVRGVLDPQGKLMKRYDKSPAPAQEGDSIAANLISIGLQQVVASGTAQRLNADGLGRLQPAGKTGTTNDGRDSWYAGYTGDHLAVIWMGNDQNEQAGLYGATGSMRVWSSIFQRLPSAPLKVSSKGLDWQYVEASGTSSTDESCPGARRFPFVVGYAPAYAPCAPPPAALPEEEGGEGSTEGGGWRSWFGMGKKPEPAAEPAPAPATTPPAR
ncbi:MAG: penicillin-binding transpeptidase domain-containing protein, partial [Stenotrophomonas sp.]